jgi:hypothetical protein
MDAMVALVASWVDDCETSPSDWLTSAVLEYAPVMPFVHELP